jgi:hypothetical protein
VAGADRWTEAAQKPPGSYVTYSILTPDEGWFSRATYDRELGVTIKNEDWDEWFMRTLARYPREDFDYVVLDYHS